MTSLRTLPESVIGDHLLPASKKPKRVRLFDSRTRFYAFVAEPHHTLQSPFYASWRLIVPSSRFVYRRPPCIRPGGDLPVEAHQRQQPNRVPGLGGPGHQAVIEGDVSIDDPLMK